MSTSRSINANFVRVSNSLSAKAIVCDELIVSKESVNVVKLLKNTMEQMKTLEAKVKNLENQLKTVNSSQGKIGPPGVSGTKGDSGPPGVKGSSGERGPSGSQGKPGDRGLKGDNAVSQKCPVPTKFVLGEMKDGQGLVWSSSDKCFTAQTIFEN